MDRTAADPMIGRVLDGRYRIGPRIARGGMATVYVAHDLRLERTCAVKIMHGGLGDDGEFASRFVREARSAARLSHPNVVAVYDQGTDGQTVFLVMEFIEGHTLRDVIRREAPMSPAKALALLDPVLSALAAAHQSGLIHRDVKPENVLIADDGRTKVADFGLARAVNADTQHTATGGVLIGTVSYLAPELVIENRADARSDVYAAGVLLYELLTGRKPHEGESPIQIAYKHVHTDIPAPSELEPGIPPYVDALVARATSRDRELRPTDARVFQHQLRRVQAALAQGVLDDPELTEDLTPVVLSAPFDSIDYVNEPAEALDGRDHTSVIEPLPLAKPPARRADPPAGGPPTRTVRPEGAGQPARPKKRRRSRGPLLLALVLVLAVGAAYTGWYLGVGRYTSTPAVINLSSAEAAKKVEASGLTFVVSGEAFSETVTAGSVISTKPAAGSRILDDGTVRAIVSLGPERYLVPRLSGLSVTKAQQALEANHLALGDVKRVFDEKIAKGLVMSSTPKARAELRPGTPVDLTVSRGRQPIPVKDYTGTDAKTATKKLTKLGLDVFITEENSDTVREGRVISQTPSSGSLFRGDEVRLVVSRGPVLVEVPDVVPMGLESATSTLTDLGFVVETRESDNYVGLQFVVGQSPQAGELLPKGSVIVLYLV